jgi:4-carboxymuconolactone decarboxylase
MNMSKSFGVIFLAVAGMLLGGSIHAQNPVRDGFLPAEPLPRDIYPDSRSRLPLPKREDMDADDKKILDQLTRESELHDGMEQPGVLLWDPKLAKLLGEVGHYLEYETALPDRLLEIAVLVTAREMDSQYEWTQGETHGRNPKDPRHIEPAIIDIIKYGKPVVGLGEKETAIIAFGRETFGQKMVSSETFAQVLRLFGRKGTVDLFWLMAYVSEIAAEQTAFDNQLRSDQKPLLPRLIHLRNPARFAAAAADPLPKDVYPDSRYRLPLPNRENMDAGSREVFEELTHKSSQYNVGLKEELPVGIEQLAVRLWDPKLAKAKGEVGHYLKYEIGLPDRLLEIAVLVTAREMDSQYEWTQWETHGRDPKDPRHIEPAIIDIIKYGKPVVGLGEKETAIIAFGRETFGQKMVSSETFAQVLRLFGRKGTVDLLWLMANYIADEAEQTAFDNQVRADQKPLLPAR